MFALRFVKNNRPSVFLIAALSLVGALSFITIAGRVDLVTYARAPSNVGSNAEGVTASAALDWQIETISTAYAYDTIQFGASLALDKNDHPRISYYDPGSGDLIYAYRGASTWQKTTVDSGGDVGMHTSLVLDSNDYPHVGYCDVSNLHLKYAHYDGSSWMSDDVDLADYTGEFGIISISWGRSVGDGEMPTQV